MYGLYSNGLRKELVDRYMVMANTIRAYIFRAYIVMALHRYDLSEELVDDGDVDRRLAAAALSREAEQPGLQLVERECAGLVLVERLEQLLHVHLRCRRHSLLRGRP